MSFWAGTGAALLSGAASLLGGERANAQNVDVMREQQSWQEAMSNTAHTREVADLKNAGLNPILSVNAGASHGSVSSPTMENSIGNAVSTAIQYKQMATAAEKAKEEIALLKAQKNKTNTETNILKPSETKSGILDDALRGTKEIYDWIRSATGTNSKRRTPEQIEAEQKFIDRMKKNGGSPIKLKGEP